MAPRKHRLFLPIWILLPTLFCFVGGWVVWAWEMEEQPIKSESFQSLSAEHIRSLKSGDVILREGFGLVSSSIAEHLKGKFRFSHCGVLVETDSGLQVIHTVSSSLSNIDGMQQCSFAEFIRQSKPGSLAITRLKKPEDRYILVEQVEWYLKQKVGFDHRFDAQDSTHLYCSEMIWRGLLRGGGSDILQPHKQHAWGQFSFDMFFDERFFDLIFIQKTAQNQ